jgi:ABC-type multidrug transport system fused ATPase/permease subunit
MDPTLFKYVRRYSLREQIYLLIFTVLSFPFLYASLELPKIIVNEAIGSDDFPRDVYGYDFEQIEYLMVLCGIFLVLVLFNGAFKYFINVFKGQVGERMLRRLRYTLFSRVLRFPTPHFRRTSQGEVIAMVTAEVEPLGGFIGDAYALPAFQGGTLLTILTFMFVQDWVLGVAAVALYPLQMYLIPKLQAHVNALAKERVRTVRRLSERIGETIANIDEVHTHDTSEFHRTDFAVWVGRIYEIRYKIYRKKFFIKFLNNFIAQVTPFFFFSIGGYLVIIGDLTFGALVAVLAAYKDLSSPWKELLNWYQRKEDARIKYEQLIEQFHPGGMLDEAMQAAPDGPVEPLKSPVLASNLTLIDDGGVKVVDGVSFQFDLDEAVALVGGSGGGADGVAKLLARLQMPTSGTVHMGGQNLADLPQAVTGRRLAYVGPNVTLMQASIRKNLHYALIHQPLLDPNDLDPDWERYVDEAKKSGNTISNPQSDWIDYEAAGVSGPDALAAKTEEILNHVELENEVFTFGLRGRFAAKDRPELAEKVLFAREMLQERLQEKTYRNLVEPFNRERYNRNMSVAENLLFGTPVGPEFELENIGDNAYIRAVLERVGLLQKFLEVGLEIARIMVDIFRDLPPGHEYFERFSFISAEALPDFQAIIRSADADGLDALDATKQSQLRSLPFQLVVSRHRLGLIDENAETRLLEARDAFYRDLPKDLTGAIDFFDRASYNDAASVQDNILFGKIVYGRAQSQTIVGNLIGEVIESLGLHDSIVELGLDHEVGIGGSRMSAGQRQKIALARALLKQPDLLILDQALSGLDPATQARLEKKLLAEPRTQGIVSVFSTPDAAIRFDRAIVFEGGRIVQQGLVSDLFGEGSLTGDAMVGE